MTQGTIDFDRPVPPMDPNILADDVERATSLSRRVLERLRQGPATNTELSEIGGLRYSGRIYDLRRAGYRITSKRIAGGLWMHELVGGPQVANGR